MKKPSKPFLFKLATLCWVLSIGLSLLANVSGIQWFIALAVVCGLVALPCTFVGLIKALNEEQAKAKAKAGGQGAAESKTEPPQAQD